ncbi:hypothetical protein AWC29_14025 [Mycobacterium triplex]|uniref:Transmembrane protein rich in alanine, arginine and proline n=1 Tax=Mycobacterium triplex TaxID=47839 RepID=A0A024K5D6_9MYCO|nr:DUF6779 domain-containing protein [Mycobacterium triplex]ORX04173.1 hypothetical protein AWC29_14025 [Mycobacterium triplex]CDO91131.1 transmembrane protein rich in alanine, arginine and proline [Mycobacterium triplex]
MTVLSRGARVRRGGRRPGWVLLTTLLVLAIGASSALVFTNRVELLKLAVILALWAAVAGAFVSVLYRRQSDADQSRVRDLKLVYDLQLDREISARREYELTVESQLRRELASEIRAQAADDLAALRAEVAALRTSLEILFDTDLEQRPALETLETDTPPARAYSDWDRNGEGAGVDWVTSDRVTSVRESASAEPRTDESAIIDVPEEPLLPPRSRERARFYESRHEAAYPSAQQFQYPEAPSHVPPQEAPYQPPPMPAAAEPDQRFEPQHWQPASAPEPQPGPVRPDWQPVNADGLWLPPGAPGGSWAGGGVSDAPASAPSGRRRRRHADPDEQFDGPPPAEHEPPAQPGESGRRARSRHSAEYRDYSVRNFISTNEPGAPPPPPAAAAAPPPPPHTRQAPQDAASPPRLAPGPHLEPAPRHLGADEGSDGGEGTQTGGQSVADLLARLQVQPSGGGRRRRREG